jgi:hypothetical protein
MATRTIDYVLWLCPILMPALAALVFTLMAFSVPAVILVTLLLVCPVIGLYWLVVALHRKKDVMRASHRVGP